MLFLCLRLFPCWQYIRIFADGAFGRRAKKTAFSVASVADRFIPMMRMWTVPDARSAERLMSRFNFEFSAATFNQN
jgi:hypothetical protein